MGPVPHDETNHVNIKDEKFIVNLSASFTDPGSAPLLRKLLCQFRVPLTPARSAIRQPADKHL
jgi:hypothetical protein